MLNNIISHRKSSELKYNIKETAIAHDIISSTRRKSFISSLLLSLGVMLNKKYASKELLLILNSLGFCSSYEDIQLFDASVLHQPQDQKINGTFLQYVFDNADHNINTIDGRNTFHAMGVIEIATPLNLVKSSNRIEKLKKSPLRSTLVNLEHLTLNVSKTNMTNAQKTILQKYSSDVVCIDGTHGLNNYNFHSGWESVTVENFDTLHPIKIKPTISATDVLWIIGRQNHPDYFIGWNGFMEKITSNLKFERSKVEESGGMVRSG